MITSSSSRSATTTRFAPKAQVAELPPGTRETAGASPARGSRANAVGTTSAINRVVAGSNPALHPIHGGGSSVVEHVRVSALLVARFLVTDPEEVEGPGCDPGARRFESARSPQSACRLMVKAPV